MTEDDSAVSSTGTLCTQCTSSADCCGCIKGSDTGWSSSFVMCSTCDSSSTECTGCSASGVACSVCTTEDGNCSGCNSQEDKNAVGMTGLLFCSLAVGATIAAAAVGQRNRPVKTSTSHPLHGVVQKRMSLFRNFANNKFVNFQRPPRAGEQNAAEEPSGNYMLA